MNEFFPLASAAGMTVGLAVCALIIGLALAMFFAVWESVKWRPIAWIGSALVHYFTRPAGNSGGAVYLFRLLATPAYAV
ncbi:arginine transporter permease ArtQ [Salmonella enterica subsp. enterica]|nr:arginine transporter permease ArtQ [Salmonella enterica subsp. enterica]